MFEWFYAPYSILLLGVQIHTHALLRTRPSVEERVRRLIDYRPDPRRAWLTGAPRALATAALLWTSLFLWTYHGSDVRVQIADTARVFSGPQR